MKKKRTLYQNVHSQKNLFMAWRHVKKSGLNSPNKEIKGQASEFEHSHQTHLARIERQLRDNRYTFSPVYGVLKDKKARLAKKKNPRPVAIAKMEDRVVQRAILQVLQPREVLNPKDPNSKAALLQDPRLGLINEINRSRYGVGGLLRPYGGVQPGIELILSAMEDGAKFFYQSDIKAFFTDIPTEKVVKIVRSETGDYPFSQLFQAALVVELENSEELETYSTLFPSGGIGVAQGGSLSAFAGNALLYELDHNINRMNATAVRYIDDIVILSDTKADLDQAVQFTKKELGKFGFSLYPPNKTEGKADEGLCVNSLNFLGCTIQPKRCVPSKQSLDKKKKEFSDMISESKFAIKAFVTKNETLKPHLSHSVVLKKIGEKLYGWQKSFTFCTDANEFGILDAAVSRMVFDYNQIVQRNIAKCDAAKTARVLGIPSAKEQFLKDKENKKTRTKQ